jgi:hypothetical protein
MSVQDNITKTGKNQKHNHSGHMKMMAICCGVPIVGLLLISYFGIVNTSLETILLLICPIGMVAMMVMMRKKRGNHSHDQNDSSCHTSLDDSEPVKGMEPIPTDEKTLHAVSDISNMDAKSYNQHKSQ